MTSVPALGAGGCAKDANKTGQRRCLPTEGRFPERAQAAKKRQVGSVETNSQIPPHTARGTDLQKRSVGKRDSFCSEAYFRCLRTRRRRRRPKCKFDLRRQNRSGPLTSADVCRERGGISCMVTALLGIISLTLFFFL